MFQSKSQSANNLPEGSASLISADTIIRGDMESQGDIRIDGKLIGNLQCHSKILIGPKGMVEGHVTGVNADIQGGVKGNIRMSGQLNLQGKAVITGDVNVARLQMESTVCFNGKCQMGASIVELSGEQSTAVNE